MSHLEERLSSRQKAFMQVPDIAQIKKKREEFEAQLRTSHRFDLASKRRNLMPQPNSNLLDLSTILRMASEGSEPLLAASSLRKLLSVQADPPIQQVIDAGFLPQLLGWMQRSDLPAFQYEACWALTNIASGSHEHAEALVQRGIVPLIYMLLESADVDVREQAAGLTANITRDSAKVRDAVLQTAGLSRLLKVLSECPRPSLAMAVVAAVSNLCRGKPAPEYAVSRPALPYLAAMILGIKDEETLKDCLWAISSMCEGEESRIQDLLETGVIPRLVVLARSEQTKVQHPALRCIGNVVVGSAQQTEKVLEAGLIEVLEVLVKSPKLTIRKEAAWIASNLSAGPFPQLQRLLQSSLFPSLLSLLPSDSPTIQSEVFYALLNIALSDRREAPLFLLQQGAVLVVKQVLESNTSPKVMQAALELIAALLEAGKRHFTESSEGRNQVCEEVERTGCLEAIEEMQKHTSNFVYSKAVKILESYFETEDPPDLLASSILAVPLHFQL